jgi:hypothetical protein
MVVTQDVHRYGHHLERALARSDGRVKLEDLQGMVDAGRLVVFANDQAAIAAEPVRAADGTWGLTISLAGGELNAALELHDEAEAAARKLGASRMSAVGRQGWIKTLKSRGYRVHSVLLSKELK